ncbi:MAG: hypothetical protein K9N23_01920 [Akkermansiaceae bacterium]|nr:hypothetical protein [Akkermansiaceae bacterium]
MTTAEKDALHKYVATWQRASPLLQQVRDADIRAADTMSMIACCNRLFRDALKHSPPQPDSGLVEQQRWFQKLRPR